MLKAELADANWSWCVGFCSAKSPAICGESRAAGHRLAPADPHPRV